MRKYRPLACFEEHSLALFAALVLGSAGASAVQLREDGGMVQVQAPVSASAPHPSQDAAQQRASAAFERADANGDGRLSREEAQRLPAVAERFDEFDTDGDHMLSRQEFERAIAN